MLLDKFTGDKNMEQENLSVLEIQILLKCDEDVFTKSALSQLFRKNSLLEKQKAIKRLAIQDLIIERALPKAGSSKVPVFYVLTEKGKKWIGNYKKNYPAV